MPRTSRATTSNKLKAKNGKRKTFDKPSAEFFLRRVYFADGCSDYPLIARYLSIGRNELKFTTYETQNSNYSIGNLCRRHLYRRLHHRLHKG